MNCIGMRCFIKAKLNKPSIILKADNDLNYRLFYVIVILNLFQDLSVEYDRVKMLK